MRLLIVIVNYRTAALVVDCLRSLAPQVHDGTSVVVADNQSDDDSVEIIRRAIRDNRWSWCRVRPLAHNGGFAYGNNEAIRPVLQTPEKPEYIWLLNPDTLVLDGAVDSLLGFMDEHHDCGIAGGRAENRDGSVRRTVFRFHSLLGEIEGTLRIGPVSRALKKHVVAPPTPNHPTRTDWVSGASMMLRTRMIDQIGLLDDGYFMYFEETDYCLRAARAGWETWYVPQSRIIHLVGQSSGVTGAKRAAKRRPRYWFDSRHRYYRKNLGAFPALAADMAWTVGYPISRVYTAMRRQKRDDPPRLWWDFVKYNALAWLQ